MSEKQMAEENSDESKILRMSMMGMSTDQIAEVFMMDAAEVVKILQRAKKFTSKDQKSGYHPEDSTQGLDSMVKRLTDPKELCCPISHELMKDPVVAGDGHTYERSCIEGCFRTNAKSPVTGVVITKVLNPNQHLKSNIMSFKENTVTEIMKVAPGLPPKLTAKLLARAEEFVREQLPDGSARRNLSSLLLLKMKLPDTNRKETIQEIGSLLVQIQDDGPLLQFLHKADESERLALLPNLSEEMIARLCTAMQTSPTSFKVLIEKEYICRLASNLGDTETVEEDVGFTPGKFHGWSWWVDKGCSSGACSVHWPTGGSSERLGSRASHICPRIPWNSTRCRCFCWRLFQKRSWRFHIASVATAWSRTDSEPPGFPIVWRRKNSTSGGSTSARQRPKPNAWRRGVKNLKVSARPCKFPSARPSPGTYLVMIFPTSQRVGKRKATSSRFAPASLLGFPFTPHPARRMCLCT